MKNKITIFSQFSSDEKNRFTNFNAINYHRSALNRAIDSLLNSASDDDLTKINNILEIAIIDLNIMFGYEIKDKNNNCEDA